MSEHQRSHRGAETLRIAEKGLLNMNYVSTWSARTLKLMGTVGLSLLLMACGTLRQAANASAFSDAEAACRPNLERCVGRCRSGDSDSCNVLSFLIADDDPDFAQLRRQRGDAPLTLRQLEKLHVDMERLCSDGVSKACKVITAVEGQLDAIKEPPTKVAKPNPTQSAPVSGKTASASRAEAKCDPLEFVSPQEAYVDQPKPYGTSQEISDLDGDGKSEIEVDYATSMTSVGMTILKRTGDSSCFVAVYSGPGSNVKPRSTKSHGWFDVDVGFDSYFPKAGRGYGVVHMTYDGIKYRWKEAIQCARMDGSKVDSKECAEGVKSEDPDNPPPGP